MKEDLAWPREILEQIEIASGGEVTPPEEEAARRLDGTFRAQPLDQLALHLGLQRAERETDETFRERCKAILEGR